MSVRVAIVGVTGYAGGELARLLLGHAGVTIVAAVARSHHGERLSEVQPQLHGAPDSLVVGGEVGDAEVVFTALPAGEAAKRAPEWLKDGRRIVDIGSDFRLKDPAAYERWYGYVHPAPELLEESIYGLTEFARKDLPTARLVANPGCYPTASLLALGPAATHELIGNDVIVDAKSGVSGAGHVVDDGYLYGTINESVRAYGVPRHRHTPEIAQELDRIGGVMPRLTFTPHLVPMTRGLIATCYAPLRDGVSAAQVAEAYAQTYTGEAFVRNVHAFPPTKATLGSNWCLVHAVVDEDNQRLIAVGVIDNLVKGAAGQAIQNLNVMCGLPETMGLEALPLWP